MDDIVKNIGPWGAVASNGQPYMTIALSYTGDDGESRIREALKYELAKVSGSDIEWRTYPVIKRYTDKDGNTEWTARARLAVVD